MSRKITFICLGNICRSPMAEFIFKNIVEENNASNKYVVESAGTSGWNDGDDMHHKTKEILKDNKISCEGFASKKISNKLFNESDYLFVMDNNNYKDMISFFGNNPKIRKITDYNTTLNYDEVPDPWYTGDFNEVFEIINDASKNIFELLENNKL